jgi:hypothetical protein
MNPSTREPARGSGTRRSGKTGGTSGSYADKEQSTHSPAVESNLIFEDVDASIAQMIPRGSKGHDYYASTEHKHFGPLSQPGSKFTDPNVRSLNDVLRLTFDQRGSLDGDDRDEFIARGAEPQAFDPEKRYLLVRTSGTVGIIHSADLDDDVELEVVRKDGAPCTLVHAVKEQGTADYAAVILAEDKFGITENGGPILITAFPGVVTKPIDSRAIDARFGELITVAEARMILGHDVFVNTRVL